MDEDAYQAYRSVIISPTLRSIWAEAYGDRFWSELDPPWTQATNDDVRFVMDHLRPTVGSKLVDLGCGSGCFLRQAARDHSQHIVGIDANPMAIRLAKERCAGFQDKISFQAGDIGETGFDTAMFDGAVSLDVLLFVPDKEKVLREVARILKPGARFAGTTFELKTASTAVSAPPFVAYPSAFATARRRGRRMSGSGSASGAGRWSRSSSLVSVRRLVSSRSGTAAEIR